MSTCKIMQYTHHHSTVEVGKMEMNTRVWLPSRDGNHTGQVTRIDGGRFRVSWDSPPPQPGRRQQRLRTWHPLWRHGMKTGVPGGE